jgi:hypothetical protein
MVRTSAARILVPTFLLFVVIGTAAGAARDAAAPVPVKTSSRNEISPAGGGGFFTWAKSRRGHPHLYDTWAQQEGQSTAVKVNAPGTVGFGGGIDGTRFVYQQVRGFNSDLRLFDLTTGRRSNMPPGINTARWEWAPTLSGDWLQFGRGVYGSKQQIILRNLSTGEQRVLDTVGKHGDIWVGQVNGGFSVWTKCAGTRCDVFRYEIATGTKTMIPSNGRQLYSPSVTASGSTYYMSGEVTCGGAQLVKTTLDGRTFVLFDSGPAHDVDGTYALTLPVRPPSAPGARIYLEIRKCSTNRSDIYSIDDVEPQPPPG